MTFNEIRLQTIRAAQNLQKMGFGPRQTFSFIGNRGDEMVPVFLASLCMACTLVPLYHTLSLKEIANILRKTKPAAMFCDASAYCSIKKIANELEWNMKVFTFDGAFDDAEPVSNLFIETGDEENFV